MSFVDLMKNDVWSDHDILARTEAMIASEFPKVEVEVLNRKATAALLGQYTLTPEEQADLVRYEGVCRAAQAAGIEAKADMVLLAKTMEYERALAVVEAAEQAVLDLALLRNPPPSAEPEPEPTPEPEPEPLPEPEPEPAPEPEPTPEPPAEPTPEEAP